MISEWALKIDASGSTDGTAMLQYNTSAGYVSSAPFNASAGWIHIALTVNAGTVEFYVNGVGYVY